MSEETILRPEQNYGPGNVLRAKREEYEWSVDAVAEALHLSTISVKAIEADRYEDLPGATYVMGYWRSYARLLGIDIEDTIEANKKNLNIVTAEARGMDVNRALSHKKRGGSGGWLLFLIVVGAFAYFAWQPPKLFGLLEKMKADQSLEPVEAPVELQPASPEAPKADEEEQVLRAIKKPVSSELQASSSLPASSEQPVDVKTPATGSTNLPESSGGLILQTATDAGQNSGSQTNLATESAPASTPKSEDLQAQAAVSTIVTGAAVTDAAASGESAAPDAVASDAETSTVTFTLVKDTWLDVRDKSRKRLFYKTGKAGSEIDVTGIPPFYVLIQPPDGATVRYKGKEQPFEPHKNGLYARFKLGDTLESL